MSEENSNNKGLIQALVGILVVVVIVVGLVWLSDQNGFFSNLNSSPQTSEEEIARILEELSKPVLDAEGKPVPPPSEEEVAAILEELSKPVLDAEGKPVPPPSEEEVERILKELSN